MDFRDLRTPFIPCNTKDAICTYAIITSQLKKQNNKGLSHYSCAIGRLRFQYYDEYENDNEISLSFSLRFFTQRDE